MAKGDTKRAEQNYLARTGSSVWERYKPFSHPGADTLGESAELLHDFAVAMMTLAPAPNDLILDLGAGACWCSDLLGRLHRQSIAVDISIDMLRVGRERTADRPVRAVAGDLESLPFRTGTFQKAVCLHAIHHVPDIPAAVREIGRVLVDDGIALFSEPGRGHAQSPVAVAAMRDFGVLEQDVLIPDFAQACRNAGFVDIRIKTLSYTIPAFDLTPEQWNGWLRLADLRRPLTSFPRLARTATELYRVGRSAIEMVRALRAATDSHPVIVASKKPLGHAVAIRSATIDIDSGASARRGATLPISARVSNSGSTTWKAATASQLGYIRLGVQLLDTTARLVNRDYYRVSLPEDVPPGASTELLFECPVPDSPGEYLLKFDMVAEGVTWFEPLGSPATTRPLSVV